MFSTYDEATGWLADNDPSLFGGVPPSNWTDNKAWAAQISADKSVQRTLFTQRGYASSNALVYSDRWVSYGSTNGKLVAVLLRVRNSTGSSISWPLRFHYTAYDNWQENASVALNGVNQWHAYTSSTSTPALVTMAIPANRTSTVIVVASSGIPYHFINGSTVALRTTHLSFTGGSLAPPAGLELVDDLDTASGGYEQ